MSMYVLAPSLFMCSFSYAYAYACTYACACIIHVNQPLLLLISSDLVQKLHSDFAPFYSDEQLCTEQESLE